MPDSPQHSTAIVGAGAAGLSLLIAMHNRLAAAAGDEAEAMRRLVDSLVMIDSDTSAGGLMSRYRINANTDAADVVSGIGDGTPFSDLRDAYLNLPQTQQPLIPLPLVGELMLNPLTQIVSKLLGPRLRLRRRVARVVGNAEGYVCLDGENRSLSTSKTLVLCCGGREILMPELSAWRHKVEFGGDFMRRDNLDNLTSQTGAVVIVGASHSAFSCAWRLLYDPLFQAYAESREIYLLQRSPLVKLRSSQAFARQHHLPFDAEHDVCATTGLVYRHAGLRKDAKALYLKIVNGQEDRVVLQRIEHLSDATELLENSALLLQCSGFDSAWPEIEIDGSLRRLDRRSKRGEIRDADSGETLPGLFACGLGMQIKPDASHGGEKSFKGSVNGLQSYPLVIAPQIIDQILETL